MLEKLMDTLLSKNWIITFISFLISVIISIFIPAEVYNKLPFEMKINIIIVFVSITIFTFLILFFVVKLINNYRHNLDMQSKNDEIKNQVIESWMSIFDEVSEEDNSIIIFLIVTENKIPYKSWGNKIHYDNKSIFTLEPDIFYCSPLSEPAPYEEIILQDGSKRTVRAVGTGTSYLLKDSVYNILKYIYDIKGSLSHIEKNVIKLQYKNGEGVSAFEKLIKNKSI